MTAAIAALGAVVVLSAAAQLLLKRSVTALVTDRGLVALLRSVRPPLAVGALALFAAPPLYYFALSRVELGIAFAATALTQGAVALGARLFLRERLRRLHALGLLLVVTGILTWNL